MILLPFRIKSSSAKLIKFIMNHHSSLTITVTLLLFSGFAIEHAQCELFTALVHMEGLLNLEQDLLRGLNAYIHAEKQR